MPGALDGIRIIDLTAMASGPFATSILGDQGADVIKVEPPGHGDLLREIGTSSGGLSAIFNVINRNKRSIVLDLTNAQGIELLDELVRSADVLVQNFRPGVVDRMGIGAARMRSINRDLIYVSISGYGEKGPNAGRRVYDSVMQAYSGVANNQANPETGVPEFVRNILCDKGTAIQTAQTITAALFARERGHGAQHLRISMLHASLAFLWPDAMQNYTYVDHEESRAAASRPRAATLPAIRKTADGYITISVIKDTEFQGLCRALDRPDLAKDPRLADAGTRARNAKALHSILNAITSTFATVDLVARLEAEDVPHAVVNTPETLLSDPQVVVNEILGRFSHPTAGEMRMPNPVADFPGTPSSVRRLAPQLGEHAEELLRELGRTETEIGLLREAGVLG